jgi:preprotein translocase YajC subunit
LILALAIAYPAAIAILFYFAFLRPVQQDRARQRKQLASLEVGDEVLTQGGLIGTVREIRVPQERGPTELILDLGGVNVRAHASAVVERLPRPEGSAEVAAPEQAMAEQRGS